MSHIYAWLMAEQDNENGEAETFYVDTTANDWTLEDYRNYAEQIVSVDSDDDELRDIIGEALYYYLGEWLQRGSRIFASDVKVFDGKQTVFYVKFVEKYYDYTSDTQRLSPWRERPYVPNIAHVDYPHEDGMLHDCWCFKDEY